MNEKKKREKELAELRHRINIQLQVLKNKRFPGGVTDIDFQEATGVSRASLPGIEMDESLPRLDTIYLWTVACGSSLAELFRSPSGEYGDDTRDIHQKLEAVLLADGGRNHWLHQAITNEYDRLFPATRLQRTKKHMEAAGKSLAEKPGKKQA